MMIDAEPMRQTPIGTVVAVFWHDKKGRRHDAVGKVVGYDSLEWMKGHPLAPSPIISLRSGGLIAGWECWWTHVD